MINEVLKDIAPKIKELEEHPIYWEINSLDRLRYFMECHVYAVLDFMSLTKRLQQEFAPTTSVWTPPKHQSLARFINEIVLCEESDETPDGRFLSHFDLYLEAMNEVHADSDRPRAFVNEIKEKGIKTALNEFDLPLSSKRFSTETFKTLEEGGIHQIAASFCFGREKIIPEMFDRMLNKMNISEKDAPSFHFYLKRHIEVDGDSHGPLALKMIDDLCMDDPKKWKEVKESALDAINARLRFWDEVLESILLKEGRPQNLNDLQLVISEQALKSQFQRPFLTH